MQIDLAPNHPRLDSAPIHLQAIDNLVITQLHHQRGSANKNAVSLFSSLFQIIYFKASLSFAPNRFWRLTPRAGGAAPRAGYCLVQSLGLESERGNQLVMQSSAAECGSWHGRLHATIRGRV